MTTPNNEPTTAELDAIEQAAHDADRATGYARSTLLRRSAVLAAASTAGHVLVPTSRGREVAVTIESRRQERERRTSERRERHTRRDRQPLDGILRW